MFLLPVLTFSVVFAAFTHKTLFKKKKKITLLQLQNHLYNQKLEIDDVVESFDNL